MPTLSFADASLECYKTEDEAYTACMQDIFKKEIPQSIRDYFKSEAEEMCGGALYKDMPMSCSDEEVSDGKVWSIASGGYWIDDDKKDLNNDGINDYVIGFGGFGLTGQGYHPQYEFISKDGKFVIKE